MPVCMLSVSVNRCVLHMHGYLPKGHKWPSDPQRWNYRQLDMARCGPGYQSLSTEFRRREGSVGREEKSLPPLLLLRLASPPSLHPCLPGYSVTPRCPALSGFGLASEECGQLQAAFQESRPIPKCYSS